MVDQPDTSTCWNCNFWLAMDEEEDAGECHRHSPVRGKGGSAAWPETGQDDWCGDWVLNPSKDESGTVVGEEEVAARIAAADRVEEHIETAERSIMIVKSRVKDRA